jgi:hypothetical protein
MISRDQVPAGLMDFIRWSETYRVEEWDYTGSVNPETGEYEVALNRYPESIDGLGAANLVSSIVKGKAETHRPVLDIDVPAYLVPSTRPGHSHLYIDVEIPEDKYFNLLDALADCGILESGYAGVSRARGNSAVRVPWVEKDLVAEEIKKFPRISRPVEPPKSPFDTSWGF